MRGDVSTGAECLHPWARLPSMLLSSWNAPPLRNRVKPASLRCTLTSSAPASGLAWLQRDRPSDALALTLPSEPRIAASRERRGSGGVGLLSVGASSGGPSPRHGECLCGVLLRSPAAPSRPPDSVARRLLQGAELRSSVAPLQLFRKLLRSSGICCWQELQAQVRPTGLPKPASASRSQPPSIHGKSGVSGEQGLSRMLDRSSAPHPAASCGNDTASRRAAIRVWREPSCHAWRLPALPSTLLRSARVLKHSSRSSSALPLAFLLAALKAAGRLSPAAPAMTYSAGRLSPTTPAMPYSADSASRTARTGRIGQWFVLGQSGSEQYPAGSAA
mmetsp:Transcript_39594/g.117794  ORF Transcript_39594/g.117794 Transcript_39594/m.117794 type:complete len:332 (+) Transcript_39594:966-1961(+)